MSSHPLLVIAALAAALPACTSAGDAKSGEVGGESDGADGADGTDGTDGTDGADGTDDDPDGDGDGAPASEDCDDDDPSSYPGADELCDGVDNDCDGEADEEAVDALPWFTDADGDGWGVSDSVFEACDPPDGTAAVGGDCDDADADVHPEADETWYDGVDSDCDGASDYDADGDGDDALDHGGGDCDDADPLVYEGEGCRPPATCTHPSAASLEAAAPGGAADLAFDGACQAAISTIVGGGDRVVFLDTTGQTGSLSGPSDWDISAVAFDPVSGGAVVGYSSTQGVGLEVGGALTTVATSGGGYVTYGAGVYANGYLNDSPPSVVMDSAGCIWAPNWATPGDLACVEADGTVTTTTPAGGETVMAVGLDRSEQLLVAAGAELAAYDAVTGAWTVLWTGADDILDIAVDYDDSIYVETADDQLTWVSADGSSSLHFADVTGDARLAITPDGWLVRMLANPESRATFEEYALP